MFICLHALFAFMLYLRSYFSAGGEGWGVGGWWLEVLQFFSD